MASLLQLAVMGSINMTTVAAGLQSFRAVLPHHYRYVVNMLDNQDKSPIMEAVGNDTAMFKNAHAMLLYTEGRMLHQKKLGTVLHSC